MRPKLLALCASLTVLAACDGDPSAPTTPSGGPLLATAPPSPQWNLFTSETPQQVLDATGGWEIGMRFRTSKPGRVIGFRFWRAEGETGTNAVRLWTTSGSSPLAEATVRETGTGWKTVMLTNPYRIDVNRDYIVSANTNTRQAKTFGTLVNGPITNGPLSMDFSYYGQPINKRPTQGSYSLYFVDVIFAEDVPLPDLVISDINPYNATQVYVQVCNIGQANADATVTELFHNLIPPVGPATPRVLRANTPALAPGGCDWTQFNESSPAGYTHDYQARADRLDVVYESNENNNFGRRIWPR